MANLIELEQWEDGIYQLETEDPVIGGADGIDNIQAKQLANRTKYLKALILAASNSLAAHEAAVDPHAQYLTTAEGNALIAAAVADLVASSPATLDTLNELAAALGNDPNFATTITTALAGKQPQDATLTALAALATAADKLIYATGADTFATTTLSAFIRTLLDDADAATARATLGAASVADINAAIAALVNSSPAALDTLNELATALGNDPNFATTITTALATKAVLTAAQTFSGAQRGLPVVLPALTGTCNIDFSAANHFYGQVTGNITFANTFTNPVAGQSGIIRVQQDAATARAWAFGTYWKYEGGASAIPPQTQALGAYDEIIYHIHSANEISFKVRSDVKS